MDDSRTVEKILGDLYFPEEILDDGVCKILIQTLSCADTKVSVVISILHKLEPCIGRFSQDHKSLVKAIIDLRWLDGGPELVQVYQAFLLSLLSAHTSYFKPLLVVLVKKFREEYTASGSEDEKLQMHLKMENDFHHVHELLKSLCRLIPMTSVILSPLVEEMFPYLDKGVAAFENYTRNLLKIISYVPSLRMDILNLIVKHMLKLDVRVSREALTTVCGEEEEMHEEEIDDGEIFSMDIGCDEKPESSKAEKLPAEDKLAELLPHAATLDAMMMILLNYIKETCWSGGTLKWSETKQLYRELLSSFDKYIFATYLSNHTQFIMFYICSFKESLADGFIDYLWKKVTDPMSQSIYRQMASCYIGSFLARANYIPVSTSKTIMKLMVQWIHNYLHQTCDVTARSDIRHHAAFYSVCQTCFYIFCFKHSEFVRTGKGYKWAEALNFQHIITSKLNPLKHCSPLIVKTFSSATRTHQLAYCDTIIDRNNRYSLPVTSNQTVERVAAEKLHSFFPFDPYLLKRSNSLIKPLYEEYHGSLLQEEELDDEDEDDFLPDEDEGIDTHDPLNMYLDKNSVDLLQYSISPGFKHGDQI